MVKIKARVFVNKTTGQYSAILPKKEIEFLKKKKPKFLEFESKNLRY